jgi:hypothetical protein
LWTDPAKNPDFQRAIKENRILTVSQKPTGTKKDIAQIGFKQQSNVSYLIFPKGLPDDHEAKVIGIKYDMIESPAVSDPVPPDRKPSKPRRKPVEMNPQKAQKEKRFCIVFKRTAVWESTIELTAKNKTEAGKLAGPLIAGHELPLTDAIQRNEVRSVEILEGE